MATLTYVYADRAVVVGPLATFAEPHSYDLCADHATKLTAPRGWDIVRLSAQGYVVVEDTDDLLAVVDAVRETSRRAAPTMSTHPGPGSPPGDPVALATPLGRGRAHLRVVLGEGGRPS